MRKKIVAGNWKMNNSSYDTIKLLDQLIKFKFSTGTRVIVCPPYTQLGIACEKLKNSYINVASQNMHFELDGAFTGEISAKMIKSVGVSTSIIGHSERRVFF